LFFKGFRRLPCAARHLAWDFRTMPFGNGGYPPRIRAGDVDCRESRLLSWPRCGGDSSRVIEVWAVTMLAHRAVRR
jgi:hypothetical protein